MTAGSFSRRRVLALGAAGAVGLGTAAVGWSVLTPPGQPPVPAGEPLRQPAVLDSENGRLRVELTAAAGSRLAGLASSALGYNGTSPGPTLRVRPGDEVALRLTNRLDRPTNLHTHGLRVSPLADGDNPFVRVEPGGSHEYRYRIADDHPAGTHWYHPHHHGTAADQLFGGLAGALLVDRGPELAVADDLVLLVTDTTIDGAGRIATVGAADRRLGRLGALVLVNGQYRPTVPAAPGAAQRWRIVNACTSRVLRLRLAGHQLVQVALDGSFLPAPLARDQLLLAPGNRADVVVRPHATGWFDLVADPVDRGTMPGMGTTIAPGPVVLATVVCTGATAPSPELPAALPAESVVPGAIGRTRRVVFQMGMGGMGAMTFTIDGRTFDANRDDQTVRHGDIEQWTVTNGSALAHPFHLHVWPFTVLAISDGSAVTGTPQDVVLVPPAGWATLRIPFTGIAGRSVYHCHILDHEDAGMMATIVVR